MKKFPKLVASLFLLSTLFVFTQPSDSMPLNKNNGVCYPSVPEKKESFIRSVGKKRNWLITIDGMNSGSTYVIGWPDLPTIYVYEAITPEMKNKFTKEKNGIIEAFTWSRDIHKTNEAVKDLYYKIKRLNAIGESVSILSHSWGTVIAYITLKKHPDIHVKKLVTTGSPLGSDMPPYSSVVMTNLIANGVFFVEKTDNIETWHNFYIKCDKISANIKSLPDPSNFRNTDLIGNTKECHQLYFKKESLTWNIIMNDSMGYDWVPQEKKK